MDKLSGCRLLQIKGHLENRSLRKVTVAQKNPVGQSVVKVDFKAQIRVTSKWPEENIKEHDNSGPIIEPTKTGGIKSSPKIHLVPWQQHHVPTQH